MPLDPRECRERAKRCLQLAAETTDPNAQEILTTSAQRWQRLASELADIEEQELRDEQDKRVRLTVCRVAQLSSPRLVHAERLRGVIIGPRRVRIDVSEGLAGRVLHRHRHRGISSAVQGGGKRRGSGTRWPVGATRRPPLLCRRCNG